MKKKLALVGLMLTLASTSFAASDLTRTPGSIFNQTAVQTIAPDALTKALTVNSVTYDLSNYLIYRLVIPASLTTCQVRTMATATKPTAPTGTGQAAIFPAAQIITSAKNVNTPFANFSGCTGSYLQIQ